jgi:hypothetical protein
MHLLPAGSETTSNSITLKALPLPQLAYGSDYICSHNCADKIWAASYPGK